MIYGGEGTQGTSVHKIREGCNLKKPFAKMLIIGGCSDEATKLTSKQNIIRRNEMK